MPGSVKILSRSGSNYSAVPQNENPPVEKEEKIELKATMGLLQVSLLKAKQDQHRSKPVAMKKDNALHCQVFSQKLA